MLVGDGVLGGECLIKMFPIVARAILNSLALKKA
jgi:hypothetical protein